MRRATSSESPISIGVSYFPLNRYENLKRLSTISYLTCRLFAFTAGVTRLTSVSSSSLWSACWTFAAGIAVWSAIAFGVFLPLASAARTALYLPDDLSSWSRKFSVSASRKAPILRTLLDMFHSRLFAESSWSR